MVSSAASSRLLPTMMPFATTSYPVVRSSSTAARMAAFAFFHDISVDSRTSRSAAARGSFWAA